LGLGILKPWSVAAGRVQNALKSGVSIVACEVTMHLAKLTIADMLPDIGYVPEGVVESIVKRVQGWSVIRP
jgi:intracellular sulfur oxidation DsrE/DsrF family protein